MSNSPIHTLTARNYLRILLVITLILIAVISFFLIKYVGFIISPLGVYCLFMIPFIKFPVINLYENYFEIVKKSLYNKFSDQVRCNYSEINNIQFSRGYTNWIMIAITSIIAGGKLHGNHEQYSKPDSMILIFANQKEVEINRIGSRGDFIKTIELIKKKISSAYLII